jgi:glutathione peroxidase
MTNVFDFKGVLLDGTSQNLSEYNGQVLLIVNTASKCGFTPQYKGLESLYRQFAPRGFTVLGFPCNQFGSQEPGEAGEIRDFCDQHYAVSFPLFGRIDVNGDYADPLFKYLKHAAPGLLNTEAIKWNFTKFLVDRNGKVCNRYSPTTKPEELVDDIDVLLTR